MKELTIIKQVEPFIEVNFEEVKTELNAKLDEYNKLVVTEDSLTFCKNEKKDLSSLKKKINRYRIDTKNDMMIPISEFEDKCKELVSLVENTEDTLKQGIDIFDNKKREANKLFAINEISRIANELNLESKYLDQLQLLDKYSNLSQTKKDTTTDIEQRANLLLMQQNREKEVLKTIESTIERVNKEITQQLSMRDFLFHIKSDKSLIDIMAEIEKKAQQVKEAEEEVKKQAERKAQEEADLLAEKVKREAEELETKIKADAERKAREEIEKAKKDIKEKVRKEVKVEETVEMVEEVLEPQVKVEEGVKIYKYNMTVEGDNKSLKELKQFMIDKGIIFEIK